MAKIFIIAGEPSGDQHAASLIHSLKKINPNHQFLGIGGNAMVAEGCELIYHTTAMAVMGFVEVFKKIFFFTKALKITGKKILEFNPDVIILVDYPGFNLRIARWAKKRGFKVVYFIPPQVWAWKRRRVFQLKRFTDKIISILPFEPEFFKKYSIEAEYWGHPLAYKIFDTAENSKNRDKEKPIIALLPGSRKQEIQNIFPLMVKVARNFPQWHFVVSCSPAFDSGKWNSMISKMSNLQLSKEPVYELLSRADAGIITSGTATLEAALFELPQLVVYRTAFLNYLIFRLLARVKFISLVNLIARKKVVTELIQFRCTAELITQELKQVVEDETYRNKIVHEYKNIKSLLKSGSDSPYLLAAKSIQQMFEAG